MTFPRYSSSGTPFNELVESQAGNATTANTAFYRLMCMANGRCLDRDLNTPPGSPTNGALYIVGPSPTGAWSGKAGKLALFITGTGWVFGDPDDGMTVYVVDEKAPFMYSLAESLWFPLTKLWSATEHWTGEYDGARKVFSKTYTINPLVAGLNLVSHGITNLDGVRSTFEGYSVQASGLLLLGIPGVIPSPPMGLQAFGCGFDVFSGNFLLDVFGVPIPAATAVVRATYCRVGL